VRACLARKFVRFGSAPAVQSEARERPVSAHLPPCRPCRRRSRHQIDSGRSGLAAGTGLHAPQRPLTDAPRIGSVGWRADLRGSHNEQQGCAETSRSRGRNSATGFDPNRNFNLTALGAKTRHSPRLSFDHFVGAIEQRWWPSWRRSWACRAKSPYASNETVIEATYQAPVTKWLMLQPNAQLVLDPNAGIPNSFGRISRSPAFVIGVRATIKLSNED
jgi:hypothetical protein